MVYRQLTWRARPAIVIAVAVTLLCALTTFGQSGPRNLRVTDVSSSTVTIEWDAVPGVFQYNILAAKQGQEITWIGATEETSYTLRRLRPNTTYRIEVEAGGNSSLVVAHTEERRKPKQFVYVPPAVTCPHLPASVIVTGYIENTQCQLVDESGVGQMDVIKRGIVAAVDVWNIVPDNIQVCFRGDGWPVFLDAAYSPRMVMELEHEHREGLTCATINRAGTVALLENGPAPKTPVEQADEVNVLPVFEAIPLADCQIKLVETLYLRATPGGEIIGIVWLNTEVPAFEINGYWYKVEFEGQIGYISRYHRKVLRGGCG